MYKFVILPLMLVAVSMVDSFSIYPAAAYGYAPLAYAAPISARQSSSLGPFFGYFPDMFGTPCPRPFTPAAASLTGYSSSAAGVFGASASPSGTIAPASIPTTSSTTGFYVITAYDTSKTISITCTFAIGGGISLMAASSGTITPTVTADSIISATKYDVTGGYVAVKMTPTVGSTAWTPSCTWTTA